MVMWLMSDRAIPRSYRMMEGFGVHTFRLVNARGDTRLVKFHWKPLLGAHSVVWDEAQKISGRDPDFHRRDLWEAIDAGQYPEYELGLQIMDEEQQQSMGFDLLDATKLVPEELVPVRRVGRMVLDRNPCNFFAETEQIAFHLGNLVPGVDVTNDPLLQARLFSYLDTQLLRLGGPNFTELPINRPLAPAHNHHQDGLMRQSIHTSRALYHPNSIAGNQPLMAPATRGYVHHPEAVDGEKARGRSESFNDHFSQARMFLMSQSPPEREHLVDACRFELGQVKRLAIRERVVALFAQIDAEFAREVGSVLGLKALKPARQPPVARPTGTPPPSPPAQDVDPSPALSLLNQPRSARTRKIGVLVADGVRALDLQMVKGSIAAAGAVAEVISLSQGLVRTDDPLQPCEAQKSFLITDSVLYDALYVPGGEDSIATLLEVERARLFLQDAFRHGKALGATNEGADLLADAGLAEVRLAEESGDEGFVSDRGVVSAMADAPDQLVSFAEAFLEAVAAHRHFDRPADQQQPAFRRERETR
jgi:catalase